MGAPLAEWTDERIQALRDYAALKMSSAAIANMLGGTTRSAVIGKMHRLNIESQYPCGFQRNPAKRSLRPRQSKLVATTWTTPGHKPKVRAVPQVRELVGEPLHLALADLRPGMCRWPYGDGPFTFCGLPATRSYCLAHQTQSQRRSFYADEVLEDAA
jgi:GcrA cell cycle regulator